MLLMNTFLIFGLPRSMTAWVSCLLTQGDVMCLHDLTGGQSIAKVVDIIRAQDTPHIGLADTGLLYRWEWICEQMPEATLIWMERDAAECLASFREAYDEETSFSERMFQDLSEAKAAFIKSRNPIIVTTKSLQTEAGVKRLWNLVVSRPIPEQHLYKMMSLRIVQDPTPSLEVLSLLPTF
jgi:hypothetical protein